jgi:hypothetical protein
MMDANAEPGGVREPTKRHGGGLRVFIALIPWVLFTLFAQHGTLKLASVAALVVAVAIALPGVRAGRPKSLELGTIVGFAAFTVVAFAANASVGEFLERYARAIAAGILALIALGSLARTPFTEQYARENVPRVAWNAPAFKTANRRLTLMWGLVFAVMVPFHVVAGVADTNRTNLLFNWVVPVVLVFWAAKRTSAITAQP